MPDTKHVVNIAILNMARFGTEMACFRFMLNSDISLITLFTIHYNVTKKHRGNGGRNDAGIMKDTGAGTLQAGAVWNLPSPSTSNAWRISARPMPWRSPSTFICISPLNFDWPKAVLL